MKRNNLLKVFNLFAKFTSIYILVIIISLNNIIFKLNQNKDHIDTKNVLSFSKIFHKLYLFRNFNNNLSPFHNVVRPILCE
jgi:hypothetical protein